MSTPFGHGWRRSSVVRCGRRRVDRPVEAEIGEAPLPWHPYRVASSTERHDTTDLRRPPTGPPPLARRVGPLHPGGRLPRRAGAVRRRRHRLRNVRGRRARTRRARAEAVAARLAPHRRLPLRASRPPLRAVGRRAAGHGVGPMVVQRAEGIRCALPPTREGDDPPPPRGRTVVRLPHPLLARSGDAGRPPHDNRASSRSSRAANASWTGRRATSSTWAGVRIIGFELISQTCTASSSIA